MGSYEFSSVDYILMKPGGALNTYKGKSGLVKALWNFVERVKVSQPSEQKYLGIDGMAQRGQT